MKEFFSGFFDGLFERMPVPFFAASAVVFLFFLFQFILHRRIYQIILVLWIPVIWVANAVYDKNKTLDYILAGVQIFMFALVIFSMFIKSKNRIQKTGLMFDDILGESDDTESEKTPPSEESGESSEDESK